VSYVTANGHAVAECRLAFPRVGVWHGDIILEDAETLAGAVEIELGQGSSFVGFARRSGAQETVGLARVVGGAGGLPKETTPKHYRNAQVRLPVTDILTAAGEVLAESSTDLTTFLSHWVVEKTTCGRALGAILDRFGLAWRVLADGKVWVGQETWPALSLETEALRTDILGRRVVLGEPVEGLVPGVAVGGQRVSYVEHRFSAAELRTVVHFEGAQT
jgi:hypothetical protein